MRTFISICQRNPFRSPNCTRVRTEPLGQEKTNLLVQLPRVSGISAVPSLKPMVALFESTFNSSKCFATYNFENQSLKHCKLLTSLRVLEAGTVTGTDIH